MSFFSKLSPFKSKKVVSPLDVSDFRKYEAPSKAMFQKFINDRFELATKAAGGEELPAEEMLVAKKRMYFDVKYRCGAEGRCSNANGEIDCRFPNCFQCRPAAKGAAVFEQRMVFELGQEDHPSYGPTVRACDEDDLPEAIKNLNTKIEELRKKALPVIQTLKDAQSQPGYQPAGPASPQQFEELMKSGPAEGAEPKVYLGPDGKPFGVPAIDELAAMCLWRAVLLVNKDKEAEAVQSLVELGQMLPKDYQPIAFNAAGGWACYNDMEVRFYRSYCEAFPDFAPTNPNKLTKPFLLTNVLSACGNDDALLNLVVQTVFDKEVACLLSRAQASQMENDTTEDPISSPVVADSISYYRHDLGAIFWQKFFALSTAPPLPPQEGEDQESSLEAALTGYTGVDTPKHVQDSVARSMMLNHIMKDLAGGSTSGGPPPGKEGAMCMQRMKQLVAVIQRQSQIDEKMMAEHMAKMESEDDGVPFRDEGINYPGDATGPAGYPSNAGGSGAPPGINYPKK